MLIIGCKRGVGIAKRVARRLNAEYSSLDVKKFPDNEIYVKFNTNLRGKDVVLVQSFFPEVNELLMEAIFAAYTARDLGARRVRLVATYFPYFRQDKRFNKGECISIEVIGKMLDKCLDEFIVINPHMHRKKSLSEIFRIKTRLLTTMDLIDAYLENKIDNSYVFIGPDKESRQWIERLAKRFHARSIILNKKRFNATKVRVDASRMRGLNGKNAVILDDMVSTGHTLLETARNLKRQGVNKIMFITTHGLFLNDSLEKLRNYGKVIATNTIDNKAARIDVSRLIAENLR